jgi:predicted nucleotidyltransferase
MSNILFDLSGKINPLYVDALSAIKEVADSLNIPFFVVGASARDIILEHCHHIKSPRITRDIDLGVEVADWDQFNKLTESLLSSGRFTATRDKQRFLFGYVVIDIVPFGSITDKNKKISWPPEHEIFMSMLGFREAFENSITVRLSNNAELDVKLPTLPGLAIMKIISWEENYPNRQKDAEDLLFIMHKYGDAGNEERLYGDEQVLLQEEGFDVRLAGIRLLGRDMAQIADPDTRKKITEIIVRETGEQQRYRLVEDMIRGTLYHDDNFINVLNLIEKLNLGFIEAAK